MFYSGVLVFLSLYILSRHHSCINASQKITDHLIWSRDFGNERRFQERNCIFLTNLTMATPLLTSIRLRPLSSYMCSGHTTSAVACLPGTSQVIWVDETNGKLVLAPFHLKQWSDISVFHRGFGSVNHIVVDWISCNVYWADSTYEWIAMKSLWSRDERGFRVVQDTWMTDVWSLAIAPTRRLLFWASNSKDAAIVRSSLTGSESRSIVWRGVNNVTAIAFDDIAGRVYWASATWNSVESCDVNGGNRRVFHTGTRSFSGLAIASSLNLLIATSKSIDLIYFYKMTDGSESYTAPYKHRHKGGNSDVSICEYRERYGCHVNPCLERGCQHLCIVNTNDNITCLCYNGFRLHENGINCTAEAIPQRSVVVVNASHLCSFDISTNIDERKRERHQKFRVKCHNVTSNNLRYLAVDSNRGRLFYTSKSAIAIMNMSSGSVSELVRNVSNVKGLTYDWLRRTLYWVEGGSSGDTVRYVNDRGQGLVTDIQNGTIVDITVDPFHRYLYAVYVKVWVNDTVIGQGVYRISLDTNGDATRRMPVFFVVNKNSRIYYDAMTARVYFSYEGSVTSTPSVAGQPSVLYTEGGMTGTSTAMVIYKNYIVMKMARSIRVALVRGRRIGISKSAEELGRVTDIVVYDPATQPYHPDPCLVENGGCQQLCARMRNGRRCECYLGYNKLVDPSSGRVICQSHPVSDRFLLLADTYGGYLQLSLDNFTLAGIHSTGQQYYAYTSLAYSAKTKRVYWPHEKSIGATLDLMSSTLNGSDVRIAVNLGTGETISLVMIDQTNGNIYIVKNQRKMFVHTHNGENERLIKLEADFIFSVALHPKRGVMYLAVQKNLISQGQHIEVYSIAQSNMDGSSYKVLRNAVSRGVALDYDNDRLYWSDYIEGTISFTSIDRKTDNHTVIWERSRAHPYSLAVFEEYVYFVAWRISGVLRLPKLGGRVEVVAASVEMGAFQYLSLYDSQLQQQNEACSIDNGQCSTLCLPTAAGYTCACSGEHWLSANMRMCENVHICDKFIRDGYIVSNCTRYAGSRCRFSCELGYRRNHSVVHEFIECKENGQWNVSTDFLCMKIIDDGLPPVEPLAAVNRKIAIGLGVSSIVIVAVAAVMIKISLNRRRDRKNESDRDPIIRKTKNTRIFQRRDSTESGGYDDIDATLEDVREDNEEVVLTEAEIKTKDYPVGVHLPPPFIHESGLYTLPRDQLPLASLDAENIKMNILRDRMHGTVFTSGLDGADTYRISSDPLREQYIRDLMFRRNINDPQYIKYCVLKGDENLAFHSNGDPVTRGSPDHSLYNKYFILDCEENAAFNSRRIPRGIFNDSQCDRYYILGGDERLVFQEHHGLRRFADTVPCSDIRKSMSPYPGDTSSEYKSVSHERSVFTPVRCHSEQCDSSYHDGGVDANLRSADNLDPDDDVFDDVIAPRRVLSKRLSQDTTNNRFHRTSFHSICRYCATHASRSYGSSGYESDPQHRGRFLSDPGGECNNDHEIVYDRVYVPLKSELSYVTVMP